MVNMRTTDCMKSWGLVAILQKYNEKSLIKHGAIYEIRDLSLKHF